MTKDAELNRLIWVNKDNHAKAISLIKAMGKAHLELEEAKAAFAKFIQPVIERTIEKGIDIPRIPSTLE